MSLTWLFDCHRSRARNINVAAACELIGAKKEQYGTHDLERTDTFKRVLMNSLVLRG